MTVFTTVAVRRDSVGSRKVVVAVGASLVHRILVVVVACMVVAVEEHRNLVAVPFRKAFVVVSTAAVDIAVVDMVAAVLCHNRSLAVALASVVVAVRTCLVLETKRNEQTIL